eukprot:4026062-Prymnesium_polylepis.1
MPPAPTAAVPPAVGAGAPGGATGTGSLAAPAANTQRWRQVAEEEGIAVDNALEAKLQKMEAISTAAGRELAEATVRNFLKRMCVSSAGPAGGSGK